MNADIISQNKKKITEHKMYHKYLYPAILSEKLDFFLIIQKKG
jgi:hypothetical protein